MKTVLDSSILAKLVLNESDSKEARSEVASFLKKGCTLCTVDIAFAECLNVLWKHTNLLKDLTVEETGLAVEDLTKLYGGFAVTLTIELKDAAMHIAISQNLTVYDALFIAAAQKMSATLFTADRNLCAKASKQVKSKLLTK